MYECISVTEIDNNKKNAVTVLLLRSSLRLFKDCKPHTPKLVTKNTLQIQAYLIASVQNLKRLMAALVQIFGLLHLLNRKRQKFLTSEAILNLGFAEDGLSPFRDCHYKIVLLFQ